jgi:hypothetical protein
MLLMKVTVMQLCALGCFIGQGVINLLHMARIPAVEAAIQGRR